MLKVDYFPYETKHTIKLVFKMIVIGQYVNKWTSYTVFPDNRHIEISYTRYLRCASQPGGTGNTPNRFMLQLNVPLDSSADLFFTLHLLVMLFLSPVVMST